MPDHADIFGQLRSILHGPPDSGRWERLCAFLERHQHRVDFQHRLLPYSDNLLQRWPDALRVVPERWVLRALDGELVWPLLCARRLYAHGRGRGYMEEPDPIDELSPGHVRTLLENPSLERITILNLGAQPALASSSMFYALATSEHLQNLRALYVPSCELGDQALQRLRGREHLPHLERLILRGNGIGVAGLEVLLQASYIPQLQALDLGTNRIEDEGLRMLSDAPLGELTYLSLVMIGCQAQTLLEFLDRQRFSRLKTLDIRSALRSSAMLTDDFERQVRLLLPEGARVKFKIRSVL